MRNAIIIKENDFLFDISVTVAPFMKERSTWVRNSVGVWHGDHVVSDIPEVYLILPAFVAVSSIPSLLCEESVYDRLVVSVDFCTSLEGVKDVIQDKVLCEPIRPSVRVDIFMFTGKHYEKIPYDMGTYEKVAPETKLEVTLGTLENFDYEKTLIKRYCEKDSFFELTESPVFIEIPDVWEITYNDFEFDEVFLEDRTQFCQYKNLESVIEDVLYEMFENPTLSAHIENCWYDVYVDIDRDSYMEQKDTAITFDQFEFFKRFVKITITLNY